MRQIILDIYRFFRVSAFGATAVLPILGAASVDPGLAGRRAAELLGVAAAFHAFAYIDNDICDLEVDRTQPLRAAYPLVRGAVSPRAASRRSEMVIRRTPASSGATGTPPAWRWPASAGCSPCSRSTWPCRAGSQ
ncbi:MAG: hypothetical protein HGA45_41835, partial [Chloroflexales bacterium]|nr:hypothetical protein [Chloroflexales bacterium]